MTSHHHHKDRAIHKRKASQAIDKTRHLNLRKAVKTEADSLVFQFFEFNNSTVSSNDDDMDMDGGDEMKDLAKLIGPEACNPNRPQWLKVLVGTAKLEGVSVAHVVAHIVERAEEPAGWSSRFISGRESKSREDHELDQLAWSVFNQRGGLRKQHYTHEVKRGSGVWAEEVGKGFLVLITYVAVCKEWRREGVGRRLVLGIDEMVASMINGDDTRFTFVLPQDPSVIHPQMHGEVASEPEEIEELKTTSIAFFQSLGYRRVGLSPYLCSASNPSHPSRFLSISNDPVEPITTNIAELDAFQKALKVDNMSEQEFETSALEFFNTPGKLPEDYDFTIGDSSNNSLLHLCAYGAKPECLSKLLAIPELLQYLTARNAAGSTPLEALKDSMRDDYEEVETFTPGEWDGFPDRYLECQRQFNRALNRPVAEDDEGLLREKYGCQCGKCLHGVFSPRMLKELNIGAGLAHEYLNSDIKKFYRQSLRPRYAHYKDVLTHDPAGDFRGLEYLPIVLRRRVKEDKNAKVGFCQVVSAVRNCLLDNKIPTIANVHEYVADTGEGWQVPQHTHYFQMGGTLEYAIDLVVGFTKHNNLVHGGVEARTDGHLALTDGPNELLEEIELLTRCETNDDNFGLVRRKVFEGGELVKGPY